MRNLRWALTALTLLLLPGCGSDDSGGGSAAGGAGGIGTGGGGGAGADAGSETCTATFAWLQKDAYKETGGRSSPLWPPHTTTTLDITCDGQVVRSAFRENHGTKPDAVDKNGDVFLVKVASKDVTGKRAALEALTDSYEKCECATKFLSMDSLGDTTIQLVVKEVSDYIAAHLTCTGAVDANGLVTILQHGDIEGVLGVLPNCTWAAGFDWSNGFDTALQKIIADAQEALSDYHVCNNDAELEATLFEDFDKTGQPGTCALDSALCHGPKWFYEPTLPKMRLVGASELG
jgi:hypothetical protein